MSREFAAGELQTTLSQVQQSEEVDEFHECRAKNEVSDEEELEGKILRKEDLSWRRDSF